MLFLRTVNHLGLDIFFAAIFFDDFADGTSLLATNLTVFTQPCPNTSR
jgi:hypothetical protein